MNKIEFSGKTLIDLDEVKQAVLDTNQNTADIATLDSTKVMSTTVKEIKIVNDYPATEENGVLYIKLES